VVLVLVTTAPTFAGSIIYVDADAAGANNGSSWADAFNNLPDPLDIARPGDEIHVAQGTYKPDQGAGITPGDRYATFQLINGVTLKGGYAGFGQPDPDARDVAAYETIFSGDLAGDDGPDFTNNGENSYHVVTGSGTDLTAVLDGFTITSGNANGQGWPIYQNRGGGMYSDSGSPTVTNCTFTGNSARWGGGMTYRYCWNGPTLANCTFSGNRAGDGGGIDNFASSPTLNNCTFSENFASRYGGGIYNYGATATATNCLFEGNSARYGGGMFNFGNWVNLSRCAFVGNSAGYGGGMSYCYGLIANCVISGNSAEWYGGGMFFCYGPFFNCTITGNSAGQYGGGMYNEDRIPVVANCILWGNSDNDGMDESAQIDSMEPPAVNYCCIQGWSGDLGGTGNIDFDPCFISSGYCDVNGVWLDGDYHLLPDSPCIDTGDPNYIAELNETDLDGNPRIIGGRIDMGVYEYIQAYVRIVPHTINLSSKGKWITSYIWLPDEYDVADIEPNSIFLEDEIQPEDFSVDQQKQVAVLRFSREDVQPILEVGDVELIITCQLTDGTDFEGTDIIKVTDKAGK
jgi:hypothetical protein